MQEYIVQMEVWMKVSAQNEDEAASIAMGKIEDSEIEVLSIE